MCIHSMDKTLLIKVESFSDTVDSRFNKVKTSLHRGAWISGEKIAIARLPVLKKVRENSKSCIGF